MHKLMKESHKEFWLGDCQMRDCLCRYYDDYDQETYSIIRKKDNKMTFCKACDHTYGQHVLSGYKPQYRARCTAKDCKCKIFRRRF